MQRRDVQDYINQFRSYCLEIPDTQEPEEQKRRFHCQAEDRHLPPCGAAKPSNAERLLPHRSTCGQHQLHQPQLPAKCANPQSQPAGATPMDLGHMDKGQYPGSSATQPPDSDVMAAAAFRSKQPRRTRLTPEERANLIRNDGCLFCRKLGHWAGDCPIKLQRFSSGNYRPNFSAKGPSLGPWVRLDAERRHQHRGLSNSSAPEHLRSAKRGSPDDQLRPYGHNTRIAKKRAKRQCISTAATAANRTARIPAKTAAY